MNRRTRDYIDRRKISVAKKDTEFVAWGDVKKELNEKHGITERKNFRQFAGTMTDDEADEMKRIIEEGCGRIDRMICPLLMIFHTHKTPPPLWGGREGSNTTKRTPGITRRS